MGNRDRKEIIIDTLAKCDDIGDARSHYSYLLEKKQEILQDPINKILLLQLMAVGNEERFLILSILKEKDRCVCELEAILQKTQPAVSHHLKVLEHANLIRGWKKGKFTHYSLVKSEFDHLLTALTEWKTTTTNWLGL
jgi:DNA-binding transcriptional ArsR family regulator